MDAEINAIRMRYEQKISEMNEELSQKQLI